MKKIKKVGKDYKTIIEQLEDLRGHTITMEKSDCTKNMWSKDTKALQEAIDIIADYEKTTQQATNLMQKYEQEAVVIQKDMNVYVCPMCGKRVQIGHIHCYWCGKKLAWDNNGRVRDKRTQKGDR